MEENKEDNKIDEIEEIELEFEAKKKIMRIKFIVATIIIAMVVAVASSEYTLYLYGANSLVKKQDAVSDNSNKNIDAIAESLKSFRSTIDKYYIGEIDEQKILDETIKGYVNGLGDEYSQYMTAEEWEAFQTDALGNYVGIGIYMSTDENDNIVVLTPIEGTPAEQAGLKTGDVIVYVDDENVLGVASDIVSSKIKGEEGTKVKITVLRESEYIDFEIERKAIKIYHVENEMLEGNIGYIELVAFDEGCAEELKSAYETLKSKGAQKIILDLRNNTGGLVNEALDIADLFLKEQEKILITVDSDNNEVINYSQNAPTISEDVVVLVNEYSASASEILVGALKDNNRAKVVGTKTYGKGVIQSVFSLTDGSALKLTVEEYYTPNREKINKIGITPDYEIDLSKDSENDEQLDKAIELLK